MEQAVIWGCGADGHRQLVLPEIMGLGPIPAVRKALARAALKKDDVELFEFNEAFAIQSLAVLKELELDSNLVNVNGGAIALGHPIVASGARILTTLIYEMRRRNARRGLAVLCIGGGQGIAAVVERLVAEPRPSGSGCSNPCSSAVL